VLAPPTAPEDDPPLADVGTDAPGLVQPGVAIGVSNETEEQKPSVEDVVRDEPDLEVEARPAPKKKRAKKRTAVGAGTAAGAGTATAAATATATATGNGGASETGEGSASDDGIDWSVPDFPEERPTAADGAPSAPEAPPLPSKPRPPTGTPDVPAQNPVVIDEPPAR
jgi:hypothetical protein